MKLSLPQQEFITSPAQVNLFHAGVGSGKTHIAGLLSGFYAQNAQNVRGFIGANTYQQLNTSTMFRIREVWRDIFGWVEGRDYMIGRRPPANFNVEGHNFDNYSGLCSFRWGTVLFTGSLENWKVHDGKEFAWAILDETKDTEEEAVRETIVTRLRQPGMYLNDGELSSTTGTPFNPLYILTSPAKVAWLNEWFKLEDYRAEIEAAIYVPGKYFSFTTAERCVVISSTYHNEANLPPGYIQRVLDNNSDERGKALIYGNPFTRTGGEFYSGFSGSLHIREANFDPSLPVHLSFDQNVNPYITLTCWQIRKNGANLRLEAFDEFCLPNPNNTTERLCSEFLRAYGQRISEANQTAFFYGDSSGNKSDTRDKVTDYQIAQRVLRGILNNNSNRVQRVNPSVSKRRDFINNLFEGKVIGFELAIDGRCKNLIADLTYLKQDANGAKHKEKGRNEAGVTFEKYGHTSDTMDYFVTTVLHQQFARFCAF